MLAIVADAAGGVAVGATTKAAPAVTVTELVDANVLAEKLDDEQLGMVNAAKTACAFMLLPQAVVVALLLQWGLAWHAAAVLALTLAQLPLMRTFVHQPREKALMLSAFGVPLYVSGMMVSAWALHFNPQLPL